MSTEEYFDQTATQSVLNFLKSNVPKSDIPNIESELRKDFILAKRRSKSGRKKSKRKKLRNLTRKEKTQLGFYVIPRNSIKYTDVLPMHYIWLDYISQILELDKPVPDFNSKNWECFIQSIYKADFHGSILHIVRSKCPSYVSKKGICIMDTRNTFKIVSEDNLVTTLPKKQSVFELCIKNVTITLFGKHLCVRPAERSTKKIKSHLHPDL